MQQPPVNSSISNITGLFSLPWVTYFGQLTQYLSGLPSSNVPLSNFANDAAAAAGGIPLYGYYRNGSVVMQRVV